MNETSRDLPQFLALVRRHLKGLDDSQGLPMDADLQSLGLDSVSALNLMLDIEDGFSVVFDNAHFTEETFESANSLWTILETLRGN